MLWLPCTRVGENLLDEKDIYYYNKVPSQKHTLLLTFTLNFALFFACACCVRILPNIKKKKKTPT